LVLKDILRRKKRVLYAALGITIASMTVVGVLTIAAAGEERIYAQLEKYGANLSVIPAISNVNVALDDLSLGTITVGENYIPEEKLPEIRMIADGEIKESLGIKDDSEIATIAPKLYVNTKIDRTSIVVVGIDPEQERAIKTWWEIAAGSYLDEENQALIGDQTAELLGLNPGDKISLNGNDMTITGILSETGSGDDYQVFVPLQTLQTAFDKEGEISTVDIRALCNACPVTSIADSINKNIAGVRALAVKQVAENEMDMMDKMNNFMLALAGITLVIGVFGVINTMMASVHERIKDIGIMRAVGASRKQIIKAFVYESVIIGIIGGIIGYVAGTLIAYAVGPLVFEGASIEYVPWYLPLSIAVSIIVAVVAASFPAFRATTVKVSDSFRSL